MMILPELVPGSLLSADSYSNSWKQNKNKGFYNFLNFALQQSTSTAGQA